MIEEIPTETAAVANYQVGRFVTTPTHQRTYNRHGSWLVQTEKMPEMEDIYGLKTVF